MTTPPGKPPAADKTAEKEEKDPAVIATPTLIAQHGYRVVDLVEFGGFSQVYRVCLLTINFPSHLN